jgi:ribosomal protein L9
MASTTILLREDVEALGGRGEVVKVKADMPVTICFPRVSDACNERKRKADPAGTRSSFEKAAVEKATAEAQRIKWASSNWHSSARPERAERSSGRLRRWILPRLFSRRASEVDRRKDLWVMDAIKETGEYVVTGFKLHREVVLEVP